MPKISSKGQLMPSSPIRKLVPYSEAAKKKGRIVYHLNIGQPDIETPLVVREKMKALDLKVVEYSHSAGIESYRIGLANYYKKYVYKEIFSNCVAYIFYKFRFKGRC